jgi:ATP-dependent DNA helicase RecG
MNESQNIEWKQIWKDEYLKWVCAFANTDGGQLFIGKDNKGNVVPLSNFASLLKDIPSKIKSCMGIVCAVNLHGDNGSEFIEIDVKSYANPISYRGKYYVRSGSATHELNGVELSEFLLQKSGTTWDELIVEEASIQDIDSNSIKKFINDSQQKGRLPDISGLSDCEILEKLRLAKNGKIKRAGIILFGKDPNYFIPNCKVMIGRFGKDSEDIKFQEFLEGNIIFLLEEVLKILNYKFLVRPIEFEGMHRRENYEYPLAALREILLNAFVHKKYNGTTIQIRVFDERCSIWNQGVLPTGLTIEDLKKEHQSIPLNPVLAEACFKAGYIDTWGRGTLKVFKACKDAGLCEPIIIEKNGGVEVTLYNHFYTLQDTPKDIDSISKKSRIKLLCRVYPAFKIKFS